MAALSNFERGKIIGTCLVGASVIKTAMLLVYREEKLPRLSLHTRIMEGQHQQRVTLVKIDSDKKKRCHVLRRIVSKNHSSI
jgi:hypothetical protein